MKGLFLTISTLLLSVTVLCAGELGESEIDTLVNVSEVSVTAIKQGMQLSSEPLSATVLTRSVIEKGRIGDIGKAVALAPNIYIPDYGSRITSSIYVRGVGARIDNPVIGLNIDNVPYVNKNSFDMNISDIERIEIIRGAQSTLYGRNTMAGQINIYTLSPMSYQGVRLGAEYGSGNSYKVKAAVYQKPSDKFAYSISGDYLSSDGLFTNEYSGEKLDWQQSASGRVKLIFHPKSELRIENTTSFSWLEQGGYPYMQVATNQINYNTPSSYDRLSFNNGLTIRNNFDWGSLSSITALSYMRDEMNLDNDFTEYDYFTLTQGIEEYNFSEDIVVRLNQKGSYSALFGAFAMYNKQSMYAPVVFKDYGIENLILSNMNAYLGNYYYDWDDDEFLLDSKFNRSIYNVALYHESKYEVGSWVMSASIRFDYERSNLYYNSYANSSATLYDSSDEVYFVKDVDIDRTDNLSLDFFEILPKFNILYCFGDYSSSNLYGSISRGYKAGGYNTQMFSDILQQDVMEEFGVGSAYVVEDVITYEPESSWNYEVGAHIELFQRALVMDMALFYVDVRNQQLTVFPEGQTTGRMMTNAGRSRSWGGEAAISARACSGLLFNASYGYTNAKFIDYIDGLSDYAGNYVPYAPAHTLFAGATYTLPIRESNLVFDVNTTGAGRIYWNEDNSLSQPFYSLLNASITFEMERFNISIWGRNLLDTEYNTFYFKSMEREFVQVGLPTTFGVTLNINL
ncbi:MAG: TonB-dependent receptor plug domain-containing protein [Rikenellaceae bacterium]